MRCTLTVILLIAIVAAGVLADENEKLDPFESKMKGEMDGRAMHGGFGWGGLGFAGGFVFGILGWGAVTALAAIPTPDPQSLPDGDEVDIAWYVEGYHRGARCVDMRKAAIGGGVGALIGGIISAVILFGYY